MVTKSGREYEITFDSEAAEKYIVGVMEITSALMTESADKYVQEESNMLLDGLKEFFDKTDIFGAGGIKLTVSADSSKKISVENSEIRFDFNLYDLLTQYGKSTEGLERDKAEVDITFKTEQTMKNYNKKTDVEFPELTEENSQIINVPDDNERTYIVKEAPLFKNDTVYYNLSKISDVFGFTLKNSDGTIEFEAGDEKLTANIGEASFVLSDEEIQTDGPAFIENDGQIYANSDILWQFNIDIYGCQYSIEYKSFSYTVYYNPPIEDDSDYDYDDYEPYMHFYSFEISGTPYVRDNICYMPVYEFVSTLFAGQFTFGDNTVLYTADGENDFGINTISVKAGDSFVYVNGEAKALSAPAENVNGVISIPVSFAQILCFDAPRILTNYWDDIGAVTNFEFSIPNPNYDNNDYQGEYMRTLSYFVGFDKFPYIEDGEMYVPFYDLINELVKGEFTFTENTAMCEVKNDNIFNIRSVSVKSGDKFAVVNGEEKELSRSVVNYNDILCISIEDAEKLFGIKADSVSVGSHYASYYFTKENPNYKAADGIPDLSSLMNNWFLKLFEF